VGQPVRVRRAVVDDWRTVREVRLAALADSPDAFITTLAEAEQFADRLWQERVAASPHLLAFVGDRPVGMAVVIPDDPAPQVVGVWVAPDARGSGAVEALVRAAADAAALHGHRELRLWVVVGNRRAEKAYARTGFRPTGRTQTVPGRPSEVELEMSLSLVSGREPP
jgi:RimJ/RimL family protein N-acetyltransferase